MKIGFDEGVLRLKKAAIGLVVTSFVFLNEAPAAPRRTISSSNKFEVRALTGYTFGNPHAFNDKMETYVTGVPDIATATISGIDFLYQPTDMVYGLRFETIEFKKSLYANQYGSTATIKYIEASLSGGRVSLLAGWRPIQSSFGYIAFMTHLSKITSMDFSFTAKNTTTNAIDTYKFSGSTDTGYGGSIEFALVADNKFKGGIEVGQTVFISKKFTDSSGTELQDSSGNSISMDFSGLYVRILAAASF